MGWMVRYVLTCIKRELAVLFLVLVADYLCLAVCGGPGQPTLDYINTAVGRSVPTGCDLVQLNAVVKTTP